LATEAAARTAVTARIETREPSAKSGQNSKDNARIQIHVCGNVTQVIETSIPAVLRERAGMQPTDTAFTFFVQAKS
jgi:hypothetical protein